MAGTEGGDTAIQTAIGPEVTAPIDMVETDMIVMAEEGTEAVVMGAMVLAATDSEDEAEAIGVMVLAAMDLEDEVEAMGVLDIAVMVPGAGATTTATEDTETMDMETIAHAGGHRRRAHRGLEENHRGRGGAPFRSSPPRLKRDTPSG